MTQIARDLMDAFIIGRDSSSPDLATELYTRWFTRSRPVPPSPGVSVPIIARARTGHVCTWQFDDGWTAVAPAADGAVLARREEYVAVVGPGDFVNLTRLAAPVLAGDQLAVCRRRDRGDAHAGWWYTWSADAGEPAMDDLVRMYWHAPPDAVALVVEALTSTLEASALPYLMKVPVTPELFGRADAVVTYVSSDGWESLKDALRDAHTRVAPFLGREVPPMTLRLGHGAAVAQDPGNGMSFGQSRCAAVAHGVTAALDQHIDTPADAVAIIAESLRDAGIDAEHPWLRDHTTPTALSPW